MDYRCQKLHSYLDDQKVENLEQAATTADNYALVHNLLLTKQRYSNTDSSRWRQDSSQVTLGLKSTLLELVRERKTTESVQICNNCKRMDYVRSDKTSLNRDRSIFEQQSDLEIKGLGISFLSFSEE